jgi:hypothetical protein
LSFKSNFNVKKQIFNILTFEIQKFQCFLIESIIIHIFCFWRIKWYFIISLIFFTQEKNKKNFYNNILINYNIIRKKYWQLYIAKKYIFLLKLLNIQLFFRKYKINYIKSLYNNKNNTSYILLKIFTIKSSIIQRIIYQTILPLFEHQIDFFSYGFTKKEKIIKSTFFLYKQLILSNNYFLKKKRYINDFLINLNKKFVHFSFWFVFDKQIKNSFFFNTTKYLIIKFKNCIKKISFLNFLTVIPLTNNYIFYIKIWFSILNIEPIITNVFEKNNIQNSIIQNIIYSYVFDKFLKNINTKTFKWCKKINYKSYTFVFRSFNSIIFSSKFNFFFNIIQFKLFFFFKKKGLTLNKIFIFYVNNFLLKYNFVFFNFNIFLKKFDKSTNKNVISFFIVNKVLKKFKTSIKKWFFSKNYIINISFLILKINRIYKNFLLYFSIWLCKIVQLIHLDVFLIQLFLKFIINRFKLKSIKHFVYSYKKINVFIYKDLFTFKLSNKIIKTNNFL